MSTKKGLAGFLGLMLIMFSAFLVNIWSSTYAWGNDSNLQDDHAGIYAIYYDNPDGKTYTLVIQNGTELDPAYPIPSQKQIKLVCDKDYDHAAGCCNSALWIDLYSEFTTKAIVKNGVKPHSLSHWFSGFGRLAVVDLAGIDTSLVEDILGLFSNCTALESVDLSMMDTTNVQSTYSNLTYHNGLFAGCTSLKTIQLPQKGFPQLSDVSFMFFNCSSLESIDLSPLKTSPIENMIATFGGCASLESVDLRELNLENVTQLGSRGPSFENISGVFQGCTSLKSIDLSNSTLSSLEIMDMAFSGCTSLQAVNLSNVSCPNLYSIGGLFSGCTNLKSIDFSEFCTPSLREVYHSEGHGLFEGCSSLEEVNLKTVDLSHIDDFSLMFDGCVSLKSVDMSGTQPIWLDKETAGTMFCGCINLEKVITSKEGNYRGVLPDSISDRDGDIWQTFQWINSEGKAFRSEQLPESTSDTYTSRRTFSYPIVKCLVSTTSSHPYYPYTGKPITPQFTLEFEGDSGPGSNEVLPRQTLKEGVDYLVQYSNNLKPGKATATIKGIGKWVGTLEEDFWIEESDQFTESSGGNSTTPLTPQNLTKATVSVKDKTYTGKAQKATTATVKLGGKTLKLGRDFTISSKSGRNISTYKATITGKGAYTGTKTVTFKIVPKGTSISKLTKGKKAFTVKWKKPSKANLKQTTGYQVRWSTAKSMKGAKSKTVKATSAAGKKCQLKVTKLKANKKYYVQVRTYKKVGGKMYYSSWSKAKAVKTKK